VYGRRHGNADQAFGREDIWKIGGHKTAVDEMSPPPPPRGLFADGVVEVR